MTMTLPASYGAGKEQIMQCWLWRRHRTTNPHTLDRTVTQKANDGDANVPTAT